MTAQTWDSCPSIYFQLWSVTLQHLFLQHHLKVSNRLRQKFLPFPVFTVAGLKAFQTIVSQMLVAMKSDIPEPSP